LELFEMVKMPISLFAFAFAFVPSAEAAELPYRFRSELEIVHEENVRDRSLQPRADEFVFADAMAVSVPERAVLISASASMRRVGALSTGAAR
jgi:hypothetical protein